MRSAAVDATDRPADAAPPSKDKIVIALIVFFAVVALTVEAYWLVFHQVMETRTDPIARLLALYWPADYSYRIPGYPVEKSFALALESVNTLVTQWLSFLLIWAILKRRPYRYALQLTVATYTFYGTFLYYFVAHLSGYAVADKSTYAFVMLYLANLPWLVGYAWIGADAFRAIVGRYRASEVSSGSGR